MGLEYTIKHCGNCGKTTKHFRPGTNHILHLLLSVFTLGIWFIVWIGCTIKVGGWKCEACGK